MALNPLRASFEKDLSAVFHNSNEFATIHKVSTGKFEKDIAIIMDHEGINERQFRQKERPEGVFVGELLVYMQYKDIGFKPVRYQKINIDNTVYTILTSEVEEGELILELEVNDE